jgi:hypothetical protein
MMRGFIAAGLGLGIAAQLLVPIEVFAADPTGVAFDQPGPISIAEPAAAATDPSKLQQVRFAVVNGLPDASTLTLALVPASGIPATLATPFRPLAASSAACRVEPVPAGDPGDRLATISAPPGMTCPIALDVDPALQAKFSGTLIVTDPVSGTSDTIAITVSFDKEVPPPPSGALGKPLLDTIAVTAYTRPIVDRPTLAIDPAAANGVTPLLGSDGSVVIPKLEGGVLSFPDIPGAGEYKGSLVAPDLTAAAKVTLSVKDWWLLPLLVTIAGIVVGFIGQRWVTRIRPAWQFDGRLDALVDGERSSMAAERAWLDGLTRDDPPERKVIDVLGPDGALTQAVAAARVAFRTSDDPAARDKAFASDGSGWTALTAITDAADACRRLGRSGAEAYWRVADALASPDPVAARFAASAFPDEARLALRGGSFAALDELTTRQEARKSLQQQLDKAVTYIVEVARLRKLGADPARTADVEWVLAGLPALDDGSWAAVEVAAAAARATLPQVAHPALTRELVRWEAVRAGTGRSVGGDPAGPTATTAVPTANETPVQVGAAHSRAQRRDRGARVATALSTLWLTPVLGRLRPAWLIDRVWRDNRLQLGELGYIAFVFLTATLAGLNASYLGKATFGSLTDYATLFAWGLTATTVVELAKGTWLSRLLPSINA